MSYNTNCYAGIIERKDVNGVPFEVGSMNHYDLLGASGDAHRTATNDPKADAKAVKASADAHEATKDAMNETRIAGLTGDHDPAEMAHKTAGKVHAKAMDMHTNTDTRLEHAKAADLHGKFAAFHGSKDD